MKKATNNKSGQIELFPVEEGNHVTPSDPSWGLRQYLPKQLHAVDENLVREFVIVLYFIVMGMAKGAALVKKWEKKLNEAVSETDRKRAEKELQKAVKALPKRQEAKYPVKSNLLDQLDRLGVIHSRITKTGKSRYISLGIPAEEAREIVGKFKGIYPPLFHHKTTSAPHTLVTEVSETLKRSEEILRPHDADDTPDWAFFVPRHFNDALDIHLVSRKRNTVEYAAWTQGANFAFDVGDMLYKDLDSYRKGQPALQIKEAEKARGAQVEGLNLGADMTPSFDIKEDNTLPSVQKEYYPGRVVYKDFQSGETKTTTQLDFVKMLIGSVA